MEKDPIISILFKQDGPSSVPTVLIADPEAAELLAGVLQSLILVGSLKPLADRAPASPTA